MTNEKILLTNLWDKEDYKNDFLSFIKTLLKEELLLPFYENHIVYLYTDDEHKYIPLFTDESQLKYIELEYTRLDKVKLKVIIEDIYDKKDFYAISINPGTHDFIMNEKIISIIKNYIKNDK